MNDYNYFCYTRNMDTDSLNLLFSSFFVIQLYEDKQNLQLKSFEKNIFYKFSAINNLRKYPTYITFNSYANFVFIFLKLLLLRGYAFNHTADFETVRMLKENLCYIGYDIEMEQRLALETTVLVETYTVSLPKTAIQRLHC